LRCAVPAPKTDLRGSCYKHAQVLMRSGSPVRLARAAVVRHQLPPLLKERLRRGYDLVAACWNDPALTQTAWLANRWINVLRFYGANVYRDLARLAKAPPEQRLTAFDVMAMTVVLPALRLIDLVGIRRALAVAEEKLRQRGEAIEPVIAFSVASVSDDR
jgi:hypothetical protein